MNALKLNCSQKGNDFDDFDFILEVPANRASILDVRAATDHKYFSNVEDVLDIFSDCT